MSFRNILLSLAALSLTAAAQTTFEPNMGQLDPQVEFFAHSGKQIFFTKQAADLNMNGDVITISLAKGAMAEKIAGEGQVAQPTMQTASTGNKAPQSALFRQVRFVSAFPGVDLIYSAPGSELSYDFEVSPNANLSAIQLHLEGAHVTLQPDGSLLLQTNGGSLRWNRPRAYQEYLDKGKVAVPVKYVVHGNDISFEVGKYNKNGMLMIEPAR